MAWRWLQSCGHFFCLHSRIRYETSLSLSHQQSDIRNKTFLSHQHSDITDEMSLSHWPSDIRDKMFLSHQQTDIRDKMSFVPLKAFVVFLCLCVFFFFFYFEPPLRPGINSHPCAEVLQFHMDHSSSGLNLVQKLDTITLKYSELPLNFFSFWRPFMSFLNIAAHLEQIISVIPGLEQKWSRISPRWTR